ncbi:ABC-type transport auxiliary lipoprotein family protein [Lentisphaerota bacterium ZTH]|nr:membrane integrity-associated transporter subunit PqiC [Lentisphaerota bacterium]WET05951.1 ABC-type transport auxiliary lipoprotein family protein [Lentisphaerota bacterium ZTH]
MKKYLLKCTIPLFVLSLLPLFTGCLFGNQPYSEVQYYDLGNPVQTAPANVFVKFMLFSTTEPVKYKMVYRDKNNRILIDDYNKWVQPPGFLITRYCQAAFRQNKYDQKPRIEFIVSGTIYMFKIDLRESKASLGVTYNVDRKLMGADKFLSQNSLVFTAPIEQENPSGFADAMSKCAAQLAAKISQDLVELRKKEILSNGHNNQQRNAEIPVPKAEKTRKTK